MWPFRNRAKEAEDAIAVFDDAVAVATEKWLYFTGTFVFKEDVPLTQRIHLFSNPMFEGLRNNFPALAKAPPAVLLLIIAKGVQNSGTHTRAQIEQALGAPLPD